MQIPFLLQRGGADQQDDSPWFFGSSDQKRKGFAFVVHHSRRNHDPGQRLFLQAFIDTRIIGPMLQEDGQRLSHRFHRGVSVSLSHPAPFCGIASLRQENLKGGAGNRVPRSRRDRTIAISVTAMSLMIRLRDRHEEKSAGESPGTDCP